MSLAIVSDITFVFKGKRLLRGSKISHSGYSSLFVFIAGQAIM